MPSGFPDLLARQLVERDERAALDAGVDDQQLAEQERRSARAPAVGALADAGLPLLLAVQVEAKHARLAEEDIQPLAVAGRRAGGIAVIGAFALILMLRQLGLERLWLQSCLPVWRSKQSRWRRRSFCSPLADFDAIARVARQIDAAFTTIGLRRARPRQVGLPGDVLVRAPLDRQVLLVAHAQPARPAKLHPLGPIAGGRDQQECDQGRDCRTMQYSASEFSMAFHSFLPVLRIAACHRRCTARGRSGPGSTPGKNQSTFLSVSSSMPISPRRQLIVP